MLSGPDALLCTSALSLVDVQSRREWKRILQTLRLIDVTWGNLLSMSDMDAWKRLGWEASRVRKWNEAVDIARSQLDNVDCAGIQVVSEIDEDAPHWLRNLPSVPWLFYRGDLSILDHTTLGFSGQRDAGEQALTITVALARTAAERGFTVVSGGARGIDMAAHVAVLDAGGSTAVVLPQGLATWRAPHGLTHSRVLAVSEDLPWDVWTTESAMRRNRMIVDLSGIFVVPQSGTSGGSHSTGMHALKQGRVTFVPDLGPAFPGNQKLLHHGARPLIGTDSQYDLERMLADSTPIDTPTQTLLF